MLIGPLLWLSLGAVNAAPLQEDWYRVQVAVPNVITLDRLQNSDLNLMDCIPHLGTADVAIGPGEFEKLKAGGYRYRILNKLEDPRNWGERHGGLNDGSDYRQQYFDADQMLAFYEDLRAQHPTVVTRQSIGATINGETIWAYRFLNPNSVRNPATLNNIVIEGLIHAREWITGSCQMHIAKTLTDRLSNPTPGRFMYGQAVWIIPIANPDGYRYTWTNNRLWRKNRRHNAGGSYGVDVNRNYAKGWGLNGGSSSNQTSETYRGTAAFSEPESQAVRNFLQSLPRVGGFIDYHSYSQLILEPWGYTTAAAPDAAMLSNIGAQVQTQMSGFGATYEHGQTSQILYIASGTSNDWMYDVFRKPGIGIELRDTGDFGFELPESQISISQDEVWAGFERFLLLAGY